ncbi:MAG: nucleotidyltransferase domain-containing protein [bacterium]
MNKFGLSDDDLKQIIKILKQFNEIQETIVFGSRAEDGKYKPGSDIDIALKGNIDSDLLYKLNSIFEESSLPYFFDIINYNSIINPDLKFHIDNYGKTLYQIIKHGKSEKTGTATVFDKV